MLFAFVNIAFFRFDDKILELIKCNIPERNSDIIRDHAIAELCIGFAELR